VFVGGVEPVAVGTEAIAETAGAEGIGGAEAITCLGAIADAETETDIAIRASIRTYNSS
jgi:hypothetical protein